MNFPMILFMVTDKPGSTTYCVVYRESSDAYICQNKANLSDRG